MRAGPPWGVSLRRLMLENGDLDVALDDAGGDGVAGEAGGVVDAELGHELCAVFFDGFDADGEFRGGLFVGVSFGDELEDFGFARSELGCFAG